jgi:NarL family two-component system response regulator YdfI
VRTSKSDAILPVELAVLDLVAQGHRHKQIADQLGISERSVRRRLLDVATKLDVVSPIEAVVAAVRRDLI